MPHVFLVNLSSCCIAAYMGTQFHPGLRHWRAAVVPRDRLVGNGVYTVHNWLHH